MLSLSELHCTIYVAREGTALQLLFQDSNAVLLARCQLSEAQRKEWIARLTLALAEPTTPTP